MVPEFFGFTAEPFGATPDPRWLFESQTHREALACLRYAYLGNRGFTAMIAPPGMGKTTLLRQFLQDIRGCARSVFVFETQCSPLGLLRHILRDLEIAPAAEGDEMHEQLKGVLLEEAKSGRRLVVVVDEAQNLSDEALEMLRLLTNFETPEGKLMQIVLAGQPTLADKLMKPSLEQFRQRLSSICSLKPFSADETIAYIQFRLERAEYSGSPLFNADALKKIAAASQGIPRIINNLCFNSLSLCCALNRKQVDGGMVDEAITDLDLIQKSSRLDTLLEDAARMPRRESSFATAPLRKILLAVAAALVLGVGAGMSSQFAHWHASPRLSADKRMLPPDESTFSMSPKSTSTRPAMIAPSHDEQGDFSNASRSSKRRELATSVNRQAPPSLKLVPVQVTIEPDQTLHDVTVRYLGTWDLKHLHQIRMLNPQLTNIDHIEANQKIWLPAPDADAARADIPSPITGSEP